MVDPRRLADGDHTAFVSGDDADAKKTVIDLLGSFGHTASPDCDPMKGPASTVMLRGGVPISELGLGVFLGRPARVRPPRSRPH